MTRNGQGKLFKENGENSRVHTASRGFYLEATRCAKGLSFEVGRVIGISEYSEEKLSVKTQGGRVVFKGQRIALVIYEGRTIRVSGRIEEVKFIYGKT